MPSSFLRVLSNASWVLVCWPQKKKSTKNGEVWNYKALVFLAKYLRSLETTRRGNEVNMATIEEGKFEVVVLTKTWTAKKRWTTKPACRSTVPALMSFQQLLERIVPDSSYIYIAPHAKQVLKSVSNKYLQILKPSAVKWLHRRIPRYWVQLHRISYKRRRKRWRTTTSKTKCDLREEDDEDLRESFGIMIPTFRSLLFKA